MGSNGTLQIFVFLVGETLLRELAQLLLDIPRSGFGLLVFLLDDAAGMAVYAPEASLQVVRVKVTAGSR